MKQIDRRKPNNEQSKPSGRTERKDCKQHQEKGRKKLNAKETESKALTAKGHSIDLVSDSNTCTDPSRVYEKTAMHCVDDANRFEEVSIDLKYSAMIGNMNKDEFLDDYSCDFEKQPRLGKEEESDSVTTKDSESSQEDSLIVDDQKAEKASRVLESVVNKSLSESSSVGSRVISDRDTHKSKTKASHSTPKKSTKSNRGASKVIAKNSSDSNSNKIRAPPKSSSETSEGIDDKPTKEIKETDVLDETSNGAQSIGSDNETVDTEENGEHVDKATLNQKIEAMKMRIEKLEEELRDVAALEISLYSVVPEHGSSVHKVHTPARRLSRLYIHACKHWTQNKRATVAKNTVSGLVLVAKSCGTDVSRLSFWLSNTIVLREIVSQLFGISRNSVPLTSLAESNVANNKNEAKSMTLKREGASSSKQANGLAQFDGDWQQKETFTTALENVESWIFCRMVESVWWQVLTPYMQSPALTTNKHTGTLSGLISGDQQQGSFSVNLWSNAFQEAHQRLCPVRAGGHECGCLPVLARTVMEQCVARLDVAMFNAILRESAHEIPTDPVSDPIVDSKVLPILAGNLSFGSGAQLKNCVGNWSRWLTDMFGMDSDDSLKDQHSSEEDDRPDGVSEPKSFLLLNDLSDLLMLPKDVLMDPSIRQEVCPSIGVGLVKRVLCNFTPDEFCPDPVPGAVLEALNAESIVERRLSGYSARSFPYSAAPVVYHPPSLSDVAEKIAEAGEKAPLLRNVSFIQRKGYTSDEELEELDSPLSLIIERLPFSPSGNGNHIAADSAGSNARYGLLRELWSSS